MSFPNSPLCRLIHSTPGAGYQELFRPGEHGLAWLGLALLRLAPDEVWRAESGDKESALVVLGGQCRVTIGACQWEDVGSRADVFSGPATALYVPRRSAVEITAASPLEIAHIFAPGDADLPPALVTPAEVRVASSGAANWQREVRLIFPPGSAISQRLIIGETLNPPGNWSGIPPHKHDGLSATENRLEEFYLFQVRPKDGFAVQLSYAGQRQETLVVRDGDAVLLLNGYHPTVATPGATVCYLWALAGERKTYHISTDPRFSWVGAAESAINAKPRS